MISSCGFSDLFEDKTPIGKDGHGIIRYGIAVNPNALRVMIRPIRVSFRYRVKSKENVILCSTSGEKMRTLTTEIVVRRKLKSTAYSILGRGSIQSI